MFIFLLRPNVENAQTTPVSVLQHIHFCSPALQMIKLVRGFLIFFLRQLQDSNSKGMWLVHRDVRGKAETALSSGSSQTEDFELKSESKLARWCRTCLMNTD